MKRPSRPERRPVAVITRPRPTTGTAWSARSLTGTARRRRASESLLRARMAQPLTEAPSGPGAVRRCGPFGPRAGQRSALQAFGPSGRVGSASVKYFHARRGCAGGHAHGRFSRWEPAFPVGTPSTGAEASSARWSTRSQWSPSGGGRAAPKLGRNHGPGIRLPGLAVAGLVGDLSRGNMMSQQ